VFVGADDARLLATVDLAELAITSGIEVIAGAAPAGAFTLDDTPGIGVVPKPATGTRCARCWQIYATVDADGLCARCADAVAALAAAR
jgi:isoleucyl-tRNA synthetase